MKILAIDTSCDETAAAVTDKDIILSNITYSQILMHKQFGGVVPDIARRNHEEHIDEVVKKALKSAHTTIDQIDAIAVTFGPGLAIALGVGINKARELAVQHNKPLIPVNHMEGHIYSSFAKNSKGKPENNIAFPCLAVLVSGGHTELCSEL
jgi:N6-L-threonylcarbamoyladenine synthase